MRPIERLLHLSNKRKVSDKQFLRLFEQLSKENPLSEAEYLELLEDSSNENYLIVISLSNLDLFWKAIHHLPINQQIRLLRKYQPKIHLVKNVDLLVPMLIEYSDYVMGVNNETLINELIFNWELVILSFSLKEDETVKKFTARLLSFLGSNNYPKQFDYCGKKISSAKQALTIQPKLNNLSLNINSKNYYHFEQIKIFYYFNEMFRSYRVPDVDSLLKNFNANFHGDCEKLVYSVFVGHHLADKSGQPEYVKNNWHNFLCSRLPRLIVACKVENLESLLNKVFDDLDSSKLNDLELKQCFVKALIFNKILSIKSFHKFFPNETKVNQQTLIHEMSNMNSIENFNDNLKEKLYNVNCEFISLEESSLIEYFTQVVGKIEFSMQKQVELVSTLENLIDMLIKELSFEKLNRILLVLLNNQKLFEIFLFNLTSHDVIVRLMKLVDNDCFKSNDNEGSFQEIYSYFGVLLLFIVECSKFINFNFKLKNSYILNYLHNYSMNFTNLTSNYNEEIDNDKIIVNNYNDLVTEWINSLFDDSEDLSDDLIKSIDVKQIYQLVPLIYQQAVVAFISGKINLKILNNGLDYLSQNFLLPCCPFIVNYLITRINLKNKNLTNYLLVLNEIINLIQKACGESNNEIKLTCEFVLSLIINNTSSSIKALNIPINMIDNEQIKQKLSQSGEAVRYTTIKFETFETELIKAFNGHEANFKLINQYLEMSESLIKHLLTSLNTSNVNAKTNNENLKLIIDFILFVNINRTVKSNPIKQFWIQRLGNLKTDSLNYKFSKNFEKSIDYHYSSIFNIDVADGDVNVDNMDDNDDGLFDTISIEYCLSEMTKVNNDFVELFHILHKHEEPRNESFTRSINLIHFKLLNDLRNFQL